MDMGFTQKQTVAILYIITCILALSAVVVLQAGAYNAIIFIIAILVCMVFAFKLYKLNHKQNIEKAEEETAFSDTEKEN